MGSIPQQDYEPLRQASAEWIGSLVATGEYAGWLVEYERAIVAGGGMLLGDIGPGPGCYRMSRRAHIVNVYTEPDHRRRGLARQLMQTMLDWCEHHGFNMVTLHASDEGRPLYQSLGFTPTNEMRLRKRP